MVNRGREREREFSRILDLEMIGRCIGKLDDESHHKTRGVDAAEERHFGARGVSVESNTHLPTKVTFHFEEQCNRV